MGLGKMLFLGGVVAFAAVQAHGSQPCDRKMMKPAAETARKPARVAEQDRWRFEWRLPITVKPSAPSRRIILQ